MLLRQSLKLNAAALLGTALIWGSAAAVTPDVTEAAAIKSSYSSFHHVSVKGPAIPGLTGTKEWVPQGLALVSSRNWVIVSHYWGRSGKNHASVISIASTATNKRVKTFYLYESGSKKHTGHVGGLAASRNHLWVASGTQVYQIPLSKLASQEDFSNVVMTKYDLSHKASYASYSNGVLWVGEYMDGKDKGIMMCAAGPKGRVYGYKLNARDSLSSHPEASYIWSTPDRIQGMALTADRVVYSQSCGRYNSSKLLVYTRGEGGKLVKQLTMPPMSEGIALAGSKLYISFESGARKYASGSYPLKNLYIINTGKYTLD
ncbi:hypothetical protein [Paenibacillus spongiae]|uniref:WD40 repeat domain-containing protein n=1 Tax=Paenibacillus spongiae TaxID=2909671 RepID=A0ABY5SFI6_9BACL|nr:hypothetical protein [Paenibacillus spongiae]UVI32752.1 hypothetical protein L1F29_13385 [Paenibacillus spongiae]